MEALSSQSAEGSLSIHQLIAESFSSRQFHSRLTGPDHEIRTPPQCYLLPKIDRLARAILGAGTCRERELGAVLQQDLGTGLGQ